MSMCFIGKDAPLFQMNAVLPNLTYRTVTLAENIKNEKWTFLVFYPFDFHSKSLELLSGFSARKQAFELLNTELVGVSTDSVYAHREFIERFKFSFPLASDINHQVGKDYDCLMQDGGFTRYAFYLINPQGVLVFSQILYYAFEVNVQYFLDTIQQCQSAIF